MRRPPSTTPQRTPEFRADAAYLITGGFGGLGLEVAAWMVRRGARRLILLGRHGLPARSAWGDIDGASPAGRRVAAVRALEMLGASVHPVEGDVTNEAQIRAFVSAYRQEGWPPVRGVVHAAGIVRYQPIEDENSASLRDLIRPKLVGAWMLHELFGDTLDVFILFSSASAVLSSPLIAAYAAANASLDGLAHHRRARGLAATSIDWGLWSRVGMGAEATAAGKPTDFLSQAITPEQGLAALDLIVAGAAAQTVVLPTDWPRWARTHPAAAAAPFLSEVASESGGSAEQAPGLTPEALRDAPPETRPGLVRDYVAAQVEAVVGVRRDDLDVDVPLTMMGLDSLMAVELRNRFEADLRVDVPVVRLLEGPTVRALIETVLGAGESRPDDRAPRLVRPEDVANLSEAELDAMLAAMLGSDGGAG